MAAGVVALAGGLATLAGAPAVVATIARPARLVPAVGRSSGSSRRRAALPFASVDARAAVERASRRASRRSVSWRSPPDDGSRSSTAGGRGARRGGRARRRRAAGPADASTDGRRPRRVQVASCGSSRSPSRLRRRRSSCRRTSAGRRHPDHGPRRRAGRRDPRRGQPGGRMLVDGGPDPDRLLVAARQPAPAVGPPDRRRRPHPPARGPRRRACRSCSSATASGGSSSPGCAGPAPATRPWSAVLERPGAPRRGRSRRATDRPSTTSGSSSCGRIPAASRASRRTAGAGSTTSRSCCSARSAGDAFLLTGDVEEDIDPILAGARPAAVDLLKVAHHGSATASTRRSSRRSDRVWPRSRPVRATPTATRPRPRSPGCARLARSWNAPTSTGPSRSRSARAG